MNTVACFIYKYIRNVLYKIEAGLKKDAPSISKYVNTYWNYLLPPNFLLENNIISTDDISTHCWKDYSEKKNDQLTSQIQIMKILC